MRKLSGVLNFGAEPVNSPAWGSIPQAFSPCTAQALVSVLAPNVDSKAPLALTNFERRYFFAFVIDSFVLATPAAQSAAIAAPVMSISEAFSSASLLPAAFSQVQPPSVCWLAFTASTA